MWKTVVLLFLGIGLLIYTIYGIIKGKLYMKGAVATKDEPFKFFLFALIYLSFSIMLIYFSVLK